jgi:hypothetical protein
MERSLFKAKERCLRSPRVSLSAEETTPPTGQVQKRERVNIPKFTNYLMFSGSSFPIPPPYNPTTATLLPQSVPAEPRGSTVQVATTFGTSVLLKHTKTVPASLPSEENSDYFPTYEVPNHQIPNHSMQQVPTNVGQGSSSTDLATTPMDVDAKNEDSSEFDKGNRKKNKDNSKQNQSASKLFALLYLQLPFMFAEFSLKKILKKQGSFYH